MEVFKRFVVLFQAGQSVLILSGLLHEQLILRAIRLLQNLQKSDFYQCLISTSDAAGTGNCIAAEMRNPRLQFKCY